MKRLVIVERLEPDGDKTLVFGEDEAGVKVAFHLSNEDAAPMRALLAQGEVVAAELPEPGSSPLVVTSERVVEVRRPRQN